MIIVRARAVVAALALMAAAHAAAAADLVVVASDAPALKPGQIVKSEAQLQVPAGAAVTLVSASGRTVTLKGPYAGSAGIGAEAGGSPGLVAALSGLLAAGNRESASLGTMRAVAPPTPPNDPWVIDSGHSGNQCAPATGPVVLWRADGARARRVSVVNLADNSETPADWPAGADTLTWPAAAKIADGGRYLIRTKGSAAASKITLHLVPAGLPSDAHRAAWMAEAGCRAQARRLLAGLK